MASLYTLNLLTAVGRKTRDTNFLVGSSSVESRQTAAECAGLHNTVLPTQDTTHTCIQMASL